MLTLAITVFPQFLYAEEWFCRQVKKKVKPVLSVKEEATARNKKLRETK